MTRRSSRRACRTGTSCGCSRRSPRVHIVPRPLGRAARQYSWGSRVIRGRAALADVLKMTDQDGRFSRFGLIGWWDQQLLSRSKVLVIGAGALGNEILKNLALLGVGNVMVADLDRIE